MSAYQYCHVCGHKYPNCDSWPRICGHCHTSHYHNPLPVSVVLLPVDDGLLVVRRKVEPQAGRLALPGGYINHAESWQDAAAREVFEETGIRLDAAALREYRVVSSPLRNILIVFSVAPPRRSDDLEPFVPNEEVGERIVLPAPEPLAFASHTDVVQQWFAEPRVQ